MKLDLYTQEGNKKGAIEVPDALFSAPVNEGLIHLSVVRHLANARQANAHTKTRGEVRGGGRKPWKQKGTGRARAGSSRSPIWKGGGIIFGPRNTRNYSVRMNKKAWRGALTSVLSQKASQEQVFALESFQLEAPKTKAFAHMLALLPKHRSLLVVLPEKSDLIEKSACNLPNVKVVLVNYISPYDLLRYEKIMFMEPSVKKAEELFAK